MRVLGWTKRLCGQVVWQQMGRGSIQVGQHLATKWEGWYAVQCSMRGRISIGPDEVGRGALECSGVWGGCSGLGALDWDGVESGWGGLGLGGGWCWVVLGGGGWGGVGWGERVGALLP